MPGLRLIGWCTACKRIKRVRVTTAGLLALDGGGAPTGLCDECAEEGRSGAAAPS